MDAQIQGQETEYKPWGLTAGAMVGTRQADTDAANTLAIQGSQLGNVVKQKDAMVAQGQMDDPEWLKQKLAGEMGQGKSLAATGEFDQKTLNSKIQEGIAKNIQGKSAAEVGDQLNKAAVLSNNMQKILAAGEQMGFDGLEFQTQAQAIAQEAGLPPASVAKFMQMPPDKRAEFLKGQIKLMDLVRTNTSAVLQKNAETTHSENAKMPIEGMKTAAQLTGTMYTADSHLKAALATAAAHSNSADKARSLEQSATLEFERAQKAKTAPEAEAHMKNYTTLIAAAEKLKTAAVTVKDTGETTRQREFMDKGKKKKTAGTAEDPHIIP